MNIVSAALGRYHFGFIAHEYMDIIHPLLRNVVAEVEPVETKQTTEI